MSNKLGATSRATLREIIGFQMVSETSPYAILVTAAGISNNNCWLTIVRTDGKQVPSNRRGGLGIIWRTNAFVGGYRSNHRKRAALAIQIRDTLNGKIPLTAELMQSIHDPVFKQRLVELICIRSLG